MAAAAVSLKVGFVGLGDQGAPIARRVLEAGYPTVLYARRPATLEPFSGSPATVAPTLADLGRLADVLFVCVVNDSQVYEVLRGGILATARPGSIVVILSTVAPQTCRDIAAEAAPRGIAILDAPVSGGAPAAAKGTLTIMAGGERAAFERCLPVMQTFGGNIQFLGPLGAGSAGKIINNFVFTANLVLAEWALDVGARAGISKERLMSVLSSGSGNSFALKVVDWLLTTEQGRHGAALLRKDVALLCEMAEGLGVGTRHLAWVSARLEAAEPRREPSD